MSESAASAVSGSGKSGGSAGSEVSGGSGSTAKKVDSDNDDDHMISFSSYQLFVFATCYLSYCLMAYNRNAFIYTLPHVIIEEYFSSYEVSMILAAQSFTYTISRFFASWATDHYPPRFMLTGGMFFTGFVMLAFSDQEDWANIVMLTAANGLAQGFGWPCVCKMVRAWYPPTQFGLWFAILSTTSNLVGTIGPGIATALAVSYGWRSALQIPAMIAIISCVLIPFCTWDKPSDVGYEDQFTMFGKSEGHWSDLAGSDFMTLLIVTLCLLFVVKTTCQDWGQMYLIQERGLSAYKASSYLTSMEIGGLFGSIIAGALTDFMIRRGYYYGSGKSPRMSVVKLFAAGSSMFLNLFLFTIEPETSKKYMSILGFLMGFCMYGAMSLLGTITVEVAPIHITGSAHAIVGLASNIGGMIAGVPMNYIATNWDWFTVFMTVNILCLGTFLILVICKDIKATYIQSGGGPARLGSR